MYTRRSAASINSSFYSAVLSLQPFILSRSCRLDKRNGKVYSYNYNNYRKSIGQGYSHGFILFLPEIEWAERKVNLS